MCATRILAPKAARRPADDRGRVESGDCSPPECRCSHACGTRLGRTGRTTRGWGKASSSRAASKPPARQRHRGCRRCRSVFRSEPARPPRDPAHPERGRRKNRSQKKNIKKIKSNDGPSSYGLTVKRRGSQKSQTK